MDWTTLVERLRRGEEAAAAELVSALAAQLDLYSQTLDDSNHLSTREREDAVEAAMVKVVRRIRDFDPTRATLPTWARGFVRNELREVLRSRKEAPVGDDLATFLASTQQRDERAQAIATGADPSDHEIAILTLLLQLNPGDAELLYAHAVRRPDVPSNRRPTRHRRYRRSVAQAAPARPQLHTRSRDERTHTQAPDGSHPTMTSHNSTPTGGAHARREANTAAHIKSSLGETPDEGTDDMSAEKEALLLRLLTTDQRPELHDPSALDDLLEPHPSQAPTLTLARRTHLISKVAAEIEVHYRTSGSLEQVLHRLRVASSQTAAEVAASLNDLTQQLIDSTDRSVTSDDIRSIEKTLVIVDDDYARAIAAAWTATIGLDDDVVTRSYAKSLHLAEDAPALGFVAGNDQESTDKLNDPRIADFEELVEQARAIASRETNH
ncbi:MAG: sigma factor [Nocardioides sp.]